MMKSVIVLLVTLMASASAFAPILQQTTAGKYMKDVQLDLSW